MHYRPLGKTGLTVSEIGFGAYGIGGESIYGVTVDETSIAAVLKAVECGITFFDTAPAYGKSELLLGEALLGQRDKVVISTKVGWRRFDHAQDFSPKEVDASIEASLSNLNTDYIDLIQVHNPPTDVPLDIFDVLDGWMRKGVIRAWGVSCKSPDDALKFMFSPVLQVNLNQLDTRAVDNELLRRCAQDRIGIIARTPLAQGKLKDNYKEALRWCLQFPAVSTVIPGIMTPQEAELNAAA